MNKIWSKLYAEARAVLKPRKVSGIIDAGGVGGPSNRHPGGSMWVFAWMAPAPWGSVPKEMRFLICLPTARTP